MFIFLVRIIFSIIIIYRVRYIDLRELKMDRFLYLIILFLISIYIYINFKTKYIINYFRLKLDLGLISYCLVIYYIKNKIIYFY